jgi:hypothetical protein
VLRSKAPKRSVVNPSPLAKTPKYWSGPRI